MDLSQKRELNRGFGDALARGFELAATTAIFGGIGWLLDAHFDTRPLFILLLVIFALVGQFVKIWYTYDAEMRRHEAALPSHATHGQGPR